MRERLPRSQWGRSWGGAQSHILRGHRGASRWSNRRKIISKRRNSKREWSDSEVVFLSFGWQMSFSRHGQRLEDESLAVRGADVGQCPAGALPFSGSAGAAFLCGPGLSSASAAAEPDTPRTRCPRRGLSGLRCATLTSAHALPSVCVADLGERASAPVHTQTRTDESTEGETRRSSDATRRN